MKSNVTGHRMLALLVSVGIISGCGGGGSESSGEPTSGNGSTQTDVGVVPSSSTTSSLYAQWVNTTQLPVIESGDATGFPVRQVFKQSAQSGYSRDFLFVSDSSMLDKRTYHLTTPKRSTEGDLFAVLGVSSTLGGTAGDGFIWLPNPQLPDNIYYTEDLEPFAVRSNGSLCLWDGHTRPTRVNVPVTPKPLATKEYSTWTCYEGSTNKVTGYLRYEYSAQTNSSGNVEYGEYITRLDVDRKPTGDTMIDLWVFSPQLKLIAAYRDEKTLLSDGKISHWLGKMNASL